MDARRRDEVRLWLYVLEVYGEIFDELNRSLKAQAGISLTKYDALAQLYRFPDGLSMSALSTALKVTNGNVSGLVSRLVKDGLAEKRMSDTDRRSFSALMTPEGRSTFEHAIRVHDSILSKHLSRLNSEELGTAVQALRRVASSFKTSSE